MTLKEHTVKSYDEDLKSIAATLEEEAQLVLESLGFVKKAIVASNPDLIDIIKDHDYKINSLDLLVEKKVTAMLALRQPMALDLRYVVSALKVSSNLERVGDQSKTIVKKLLKVEKLGDGVKASLLKMLEVSEGMILDSVRAFNAQNVELAEKVLQKDDEIDEIYRDLFRITRHERFTHDELENVVNILFVAKSFERLADNATNIAEVAGYVVTGETL